MDRTPTLTIQLVWFAGAFHPPPDRSLIVRNTGVPICGDVWVDGSLDPVAGQKKGADQTAPASIQCGYMNVYSGCLIIFFVFLYTKLQLVSR